MSEPIHTGQRSTVTIKGVPEKLTPQQCRVFQMLCGTRVNKEIAATLGISLRGASYHIRLVYVKSGVADRVEFWKKFGFHPGDSGPMIQFGGSGAAEGAAPPPKSERVELL
jgi:DNA-binding NarL/FixJ family response regulator